MFLIRDENDPQKFAIEYDEKETRRYTAAERLKFTLISISLFVLFFIQDLFFIYFFENWLFQNL